MNVNTTSPLERVNHVSIQVKDQDRSVKFYTEKLGFKVVVDVPFDEKQRWIEMEIPGGETRLVLFTSEDQKDRVGKMSNIIFYSSDVEKSYEEMKKRGIEFTETPTKAEWGTYAVFKDVDENLFCISTS